MVQREIQNNAYAKFWMQSKEYSVMVFLKKANKGFVFYSLSLAVDLLQVNASYISTV